MTRDRSASPTYAHLILFSMLCLCGAPSADALAAGGNYAPDQLIVQYKAGKTPNDTLLLNAQYGVTKTERVFKLLETLGQARGKSVLSTTEFLALAKNQYPLRAKRAPANAGPTPHLEDFYLLQLRPGTNVMSAATDYHNHSAVSFAEPNYVVRISFTTDDPFYSSSNAFSQNGTFPDLWGLRQIKADQAWDLLNNLSKPVGGGVTIAIVDTGVDCTHPDLLDACDTARSSMNYAGCVPGQPCTPSNNAADDNGHGTHVAGIIAARQGNGRGILGVAYQSTILPIKALDQFGLGYSSNVAQGITYAASPGIRADVINLSVGGDNPGNVVGAALAAARQVGIVMVASAGNSGLNPCDKANTGPPCLDHPARSPDTIAVGATTHEGQVANWSSRAATVPDSMSAHHLVAPGGEHNDAPPLNADFTLPGADILSLVSSQTTCTNTPFDCFRPALVPGGGLGVYGRARGTSFSAAYVSGVVALMLAENPLISIDQVATVLELTATDLEPPGPDAASGFGLVDAEKAVMVAGLIQ